MKTLRFRLVPRQDLQQNLPPKMEVTALRTKFMAISPFMATCLRHINIHTIIIIITVSNNSHPWPMYAQFQYQIITRTLQLTTPQEAAKATPNSILH